MGEISEQVQVTVQQAAEGGITVPSASAATGTLGGQEKTIQDILEEREEQLKDLE